MNSNNKLLNTVDAMVDYLMLNVLWLIFSIPLITIFPATTAMVGVIRKRQLGLETKGIFRDFLSLFKANFGQSFMISIIWMIMALFLYFDYSFINPQQSILQLLLYIVLIIGIILFMAMTVYLFPTIAHFELTWKLVIRNAFFFSLMNPIVTVLLLVTFALGAICVYSFPASVFIISSPLSFVIYYLCQHLFTQVVMRKEMN